MPYVKPPAIKQERKTYPNDLSDAEWHLVEGLLPVTRPRGQQRIHSYRDIIDGVVYVLKGAIGWRAMPHDLPPWQTVYTYFRDWQIDGTWKRVHDALFEADRARAGRNPEPSGGVIDSQTARTTEKGGPGVTTGPRGWLGARGTSSSIRKAG